MQTPTCAKGDVGDSPAKLESVVSHVLAWQERMAMMTELVRQSVENSQRQQKWWYDRTAKEREFQPGHQVLVLLPSSMNKLLAPWQGPYHILHQEGKVIYLVHMHNTRKRKRVLHVNMLQKWHMPLTCQAFLLRRQQMKERQTSLTGGTQMEGHYMYLCTWVSS